MNYNRAMYFLSLLYSSVSTEKQSEIIEIYKKISQESVEYSTIVKILDSTVFFGVQGSEERRTAHEILSAIVSDPANAYENTKKAKMFIQRTNEDLSKSSEFLSSPSFGDGQFSIYSTRDVQTYTKVYSFVANSICYYLASRYGVRELVNLSFNFGDDFISLAKRINDEYARELLVNRGIIRIPTWEIKKIKNCDTNFIEYDGFVIEYSNMPFNNFTSVLSESHYKRVNPHYYVPTDQKDTVCWGVGNIIGIELDNAISLIGGTCITSLPVDAFGVEELNLENSYAQIKRALQTDRFCIPPDDLVAALDRWSLCRTVHQRKINGRCVICGCSQQENTLACKKHFQING